MLDPRRVLADEVLAVLLHRGRDRARVPRKASLADAAQPFIGLDNDEEPVSRPNVDDERLDQGDLQLTSPNAAAAIPPAMLAQRARSLTRTTASAPASPSASASKRISPGSPF